MEVSHPSRGLSVSPLAVVPLVLVLRDVGVHRHLARHLFVGHPSGCPRIGLDDVQTALCRLSTRLLVQLLGGGRRRVQPLVHVVVVHLQLQGAVVGLAVGQVGDALLLLVVPAQRVDAGGPAWEVVGLVERAAGGVGLPRVHLHRGVVDVAEGQRDRGTEGQTVNPKLTSKQPIYLFIPLLNSINAILIL